MGKFIDAIKETAQQFKISMDVMKELEPTSFDISDMLIRNKGESYYDWSVRVYDKVTSVLGTETGLINPTTSYYEKRNYVVYVWYTLSKVFAQEGQGTNYYREIHARCVDLANYEMNLYLSVFMLVKYHKKVIDPLKLPSNPDKVEVLLKEYYCQGYKILRKNVETKSFDGNEAILLEMLF